MGEPMAMDEWAITDQLAALLDLDRVDRADADDLLHQSAGSAQAGAVVVVAMAVLGRRLGTFPAHPARNDLGEKVWICAILRFVPQMVRWHRAQQIDPGITEHTLADIGRHFRLHRQTHHAFGLETWWFLTYHLAGGLFQLGRLQFVLRPPSPRHPEPPADAPWMLDVHIPPTGPLLPDVVDASFREAVAFFGTHFPDRPAAMALCTSWLLDPYLAEQLPGTNIGRFQERFVRYDDGHPAQADVIYFVFRTRDTDHLDQLPRETRLQRAVLDRIRDGGTWRSYRGFCSLPVAQP